MSKMIDLDSAVEVVTNQFVKIASEAGGGEAIHIDEDSVRWLMKHAFEVGKALRALPTTEIVRCKDCERFEKWGSLNCDRTCSLYPDEYSALDKDDDFCSRGKEKEE